VTAPSKDTTVLIIEDEPKLAHILIDYLELNGYQTHWVADGASAVTEARARRPALALLDLMLPVKDGLTVFREVRAFSDIPIIMVTARVDEIDRLLGLELGADDYICKPFSPREVVARVKAVLRRATANRTEEPNRLLIDDARMAITFDGHRLDLTPVEFRLLKTLASSTGRIFSRDQLLDAIYDDRRVVLDRTVDSHVKNIRRKLADIAPDEEIIRSVYSVGYKLEVRHV
jgi:two-component system, OmpR family, response regulator BaeR